MAEKGKGLAIIFGPKAGGKAMPDGEEPDEDSGAELDAASADLIAAVESKDESAVSSALRAAFAALQGE